MERLLLGNPQIQQVLQNNPELRPILNDPATMRQAMRMMQNPNLRREMMRNTDRAMANIENLPGGFDALRRMYHTIQEPMLDAISQPQQNNNLVATPSAPSPTSVGQPQSQVDPQLPTTTPLPNPWGPSQNNFTSSPFPGMGMGIPVFPGMGIPMQQQQQQDPSQQQYFTQIMQQMVQNPQLMQQTLAPFLQPQQGPTDSNNPDPLVAMSQQLLSNPEFVQLLMNPQTVQAMYGGDGSGIYGQGFPGYGYPGMGVAPGWGLPGFGIVPGTLPQNSGEIPGGTQQQQTSQQRFSVQLQQLSDMGFTDTQRNIEALQSCGGNVDRAVERLLSGQ